MIDAGVPDDAAGAPELQTADVGGRKISFAGAGDDGDVILLVHGYGGDRNSWLFLQEPLAARYRVYALDLPGHGASAKDVGEGTLDVLAGAVTGVLDALGAERAHLVGHSLGGAAVLAAAARDPGRIASLTLIAPAGFGTEINAGYLRGFADAQNAPRAQAGGRAAVRRREPGDPSARRRPARLQAAGRGRRGAAHPARGAARRRRAGDRLGRAARGGRPARWPVTVVWGRGDRIIPAAQAEAVTGADHRLIDGAGHMPHMERPAEVQAAIEQTIARAT